MTRPGSTRFSSSATGPRFPTPNMRTRWSARLWNSARAFLQSKSDRLYSIEIYWVVMIDGSYAKTGLLHALAAVAEAAPLVAARLARPVLRQQRAHLDVRADRARPAALAAENTEFEWAAKRPHAGRAARGGGDVSHLAPSRELPPLQVRTEPAIQRASSRLAGLRFGAGGAAWLSAYG